MQVKRFLRAVSSIFLTALVWNAFIHTVVLREADASIQHIRRSDLSAMLGLSLVLTAGISCLFVLGYGRFAKNGSLGEGIIFGFFFAITAGLLIDLNQYILYPIPALLAFQWFLGGIVEFVLYGIIVSKLYSVSKLQKHV